MGWGEMQTPRNPLHIVDKDAWDEIAREVVELLRRKQQDYGPENILATMHHGLAVRITDKSARLRNMVFNQHDPNFESMRDTYMDVAGYGIIGLLLCDDKFPPEDK